MNRTESKGAIGVSRPHCWMGLLEFLREAWGDVEGYERFEQMGGEPMTCLLLDGHDGEHEWTRDADITVRFAP